MGIGDISSQEGTGDGGSDTCELKRSPTWTFLVTRACTHLGVGMGRESGMQNAGFRVFKGRGSLFQGSHARGRTRAGGRESCTRTRSSSLNVRERRVGWQGTSDSRASMHVMRKHGRFGALFKGHTLAGAHVQVDKECLTYEHT